MHHRDRHRRVDEADLAGGPHRHRVDEAPAHVQVGLAIALAHDQADLGHRGVDQRLQVVHDLARHALVLGLHAHHEAGGVRHQQDRQVEGVAQHDELGGLVAGRPVDRAALVQGIAGDHAHRPAAEAQEGGEQGAPVQFAPGLQRTLVGDRLQHLANVIDLVASHRQHRFDRCAGSGHPVGGQHRRHVAKVRRQIAQRAADHRERLLVGVDDDVDLPGRAGVHLPAAQLFGGHVFTERDRGDLGAGHRH